jgi:hypothetical protein
MAAARHGLAYMSAIMWLPPTPCPPSSSKHWGEPESNRRHSHVVFDAITWLTSRSGILGRAVTTGAGTMFQTSLLSSSVRQTIALACLGMLVVPSAAGSRRLDPEDAMVQEFQSFCADY